MNGIQARPDPEPLRALGSLFGPPLRANSFWHEINMITVPAAFCALGYLPLLAFRQMDALAVYHFTVVLGFPVLPIAWNWVYAYQIQIHQHGFVLSSIWEREIVRDDQVRAIVWEPLSSYQRVELLIETGEGAEWRRLSLPARTRRAHTDAFRERLVDRLADRITGSLREGDRLDGEGWHLDQEGLHHAGQVDSLDNLVGRTTDGAHLLLYRDDHWQPFASFPLAGQNVRVLARLLARPIGSEPEAAHPLGRLLFFFTGMTASERVNVHEWGFHQPQTERTLRYAALVGMRVDFSGRFHFVPDPTEDEPLVTPLGVSPHNHRLILLWIAQAAAERWLERLQADDRVPWTPHLIFHPLGLEIRPPGWKDWEESYFLPFANVGTRIDSHYLHLYQHDITRDILKVSFSTPNFFIGWALLQRLGSPTDLPQIDRMAEPPPRNEQVQNRRPPSPPRQDPLPPD